MGHVCSPNLICAWSGRLFLPNAAFASCENGGRKEERARDYLCTYACTCARTYAQEKERTAYEIALLVAVYLYVLETVSDACILFALLLPLFLFIFIFLHFYYTYAHASLLLFFFLYVSSSAPLVHFSTYLFPFTYFFLMPCICLHDSSL
jgi:hypothetical protein